MTVIRPSEKQAKEIVSRFQAIGAAALAADMEDSHSGNIAMKFPGGDGAVHMAMTATGSQKGDLAESDICFPGIDRTTYGHYKASSETDIHAAILAIPGVGGSMHTHTKHATIMTMDDRTKPLESPPLPLRPVDPLGFHLLGNVPVEWFTVPSGSPEMVTKISQHLKDHPAMMNHSHGTFARGRTPEEAFYFNVLVEHSAYILWLLRLYGINPSEVADIVASDPAAHVPERPVEYTIDTDLVCDFSDEPDTAREFLKTGRRIFHSRLSPFHTGSLSLRCVSTLLYAPKACMPNGLPGPLLERTLSQDASDDWESAFHKMILNNSSFQVVAHTYPAEAEAAAWAAHPDIAAVNNEKFVVPIDAEGSFLYLKIPVLQPDADFESVLRALHDYNVVIIRGRGVWAVAEQSLSEVLHHISSVRDICYYRAGAASRKLDFNNLEPKNAIDW